MIIFFLNLVTFAYDCDARFSRVNNYRPISVRWHCCNRAHGQQADAIIKTISLFLACFKYLFYCCMCAAHDTELAAGVTRATSQDDCADKTCKFFLLFSPIYQNAKYQIFLANCRIVYTLTTFSRVVSIQVYTATIVEW